MDNQHRKIKGYRELTQTEIDTMNRIKALGEELGALVQSVRDPSVNADPVWLQKGELELKSGIMALVRSVAKPESF